MNLLYVREDKLVDCALKIVDKKLFGRHEEVSSLVEAKRMARLKLALYQYEVFSGLLLDNQLCLIKYVEFFNGTINSCAVYPREVVRACIENNAASIILMHNHPGGVVTPSEADKSITQVLVDVLHSIDVKVQDHLVVAGDECYSFAEHHIVPAARYL